MPKFDIGISYKTPVNPQIKPMVERARKRWLEIVKGEYKVSTTQRGITYDKNIIDVHVGDLVGGKVAELRLVDWNHEDYLPVHTAMILDKAQLKLELPKRPEFIYESILHEIGHSIGIDKFFWDLHQITKEETPNQWVLKGQNCRKEYQRYAQLPNPTNLPLNPNLGLHIDEATFPYELMSPFIDEPGNKLTRICIATLADIGLEVDYSTADPYDAFKDWRIPETPLTSCPHGFTDPYKNSTRKIV